MRRGFLDLVAIMDRRSRRVLSWRLSTTLEAEVCADARDEAIAHVGPPEIMTTDQGSQVTAFAWADLLRQTGVRVSLDGKGRGLKYECVSLRARETGSEARAVPGPGSTFATTGGPMPPSTDDRRTWSTAPARRSCNPTGRPRA